PAAPAPIAEAAPPPPPPRAGERAGGAGLPGPTPTPIAEAAAPSPPPRAGERAGDGIRPAPATVLLRLSPEEMAAAREREVGAPAPASAAPPPPALQLTFDPADSPALGQALPGLAAALDTAAMRDFLQAALFGKLHPQATIVGVKTSDAALLPGGDCLLRYKLELQDGAGQSAELLVTGRIMASQLDCALYMRDRLAPLVALLRGRPALAALRAPAAMLEPLNMVVHAFPIDGDMPTLAAATDPQRMAEVIGEALSAGAEEPLVVEHCHVEVVDYARQGRCTLRYQFEGRQAGAAQPAAQTVYGKVYADDLGAAIVPVVAALRPRALATGVAIPRTLAWRPDLKLALLETLPGEPVIADVLGARLRGKPAPEGALPLEELVERSGQVAAALHGSGVRLGRRRALDNELAALRQELALVRRFAPALATRLDAALQQLDAYAEQSDPLGLRLSHGDFTHGQLIFDGPRVGLVDFDTLCQAEPALDLAQFLVYLRIAARKSDPATSNPLLRQLGERFLGAYLAAAGEAIEDAERLQVRIAVYRVVSLLRRTLRSWQKFKGSRTSHAFTLLEEELACLPQLDS
ncbi:MAG TPA: aminoglycoside phosphotransferase family protein, partial [Roseiflexaceae bacterium]|nr:aminoglycoside phosphotransferase family protein [Roseiflexaceae bacterium]